MRGTSATCFEASAGRPRSRVTATRGCQHHTARTSRRSSRSRRAGTWTRLGTLPSDVFVTALVSLPGGQLWAGGSAGQLLSWNGSTWLTTPRPANVGRIIALHATGSLVFATAETDWLVRRNNSWQSMLALSPFDPELPVLSFDGTRCPPRSRREPVRR